MKRTTHGLPMTPKESRALEALRKHWKFRSRMDVVRHMATTTLIVPEKFVGAFSAPAKDRSCKDAGKEFCKSKQTCADVVRYSKKTPHVVFTAARKQLGLPKHGQKR